MKGTGYRRLTEPNTLSERGGGYTATGMVCARVNNPRGGVDGTTSVDLFPPKGPPGRHRWRVGTDTKCGETTEKTYGAVRSVINRMQTKKNEPQAPPAGVPDSHGRGHDRASRQPARDLAPIAEAVPPRARNLALPPFTAKLRKMTCYLT